MPPPPAEASHRTRSHVRAKSTCDAKGENRRDVTKEIKTISLELAKKDYKLHGRFLKSWEHPQDTMVVSILIDGLMSG